MEKKKKENDNHSTRLSTFYIGARRYGLGIGNEQRPFSATCVGRAESRVCHPRGTDEQ